LRNILSLEFRPDSQKKPKLRLFGSLRKIVSNLKVAQPKHHCWALSFEVSAKKGKVTLFVTI